MGLANVFMFWENTTATSCLAGPVCDSFLTHRRNASTAFRTYNVALRPFGKVVWGASGALTLPGEKYPSWVRPTELELATNQSNVVGVALDDYPYSNISDLIEVRERLQSANTESRKNFPKKRDLALFTTFYTKDLNVSSIRSFLSRIEHPILWAWAAADVPDMMRPGGWFESFEKLSGPGRMVGLYAYDFSVRGGGGLFPLDTMRSQLAWSLQLLRDGRIAGVAFEGIFDLDLAAAELLREWISQVHDLPL